ncbi:MAG: hypothetical protein ACLR0U_30850 [Enterocloster clostridioformis]
MELTKSSRADDFDTLAGCFEKLRSFGFRFSPDDFGIACSTLLLIRNLPVGSVKLDHSFTLLQGYFFDRPMPTHPPLDLQSSSWSVNRQVPVEIEDTSVKACLSSKK